MVELAGGGGYNTAAASLQGPGLNPWNKAYWSGGSSSGSGIAVAAGLVPYALGSETSGSIMTPASYCGVTGLRPTYGLVSRRGAMTLSWTCDKIGVLARSAEDCGLALHGIAGKDDADSSSAGKSFYYSPQYPRQFRDLKIGYNSIDFDQWVDEPMRPAFRNRSRCRKVVRLRDGGNGAAGFPIWSCYRLHYRFGSRFCFRGFHSQRPSERARRS